MKRYWNMENKMGSFDIVIKETEPILYKIPETLLSIRASGIFVYLFKFFYPQTADNTQ